MSPALRAVFIALVMFGIFSGLVVVPDSSDTVVEAQTTEPEWNTETNLSMVAQIEATGDAQWTLSTTTNLTSQNETEAYRTVAADFENGDLPALGLEAFETWLQEVNDDTERDMAIENVARTTASDEEIQAGTGQFTVEFTWVNFAQQENDRLRLGRDVLVMSNGDPWFKGLRESESLTIIAPPGFGIRDATVVARDGKLHWDGPAEFDESTLQATFIGPNPGDDSDDGGDDGAVSDDSDGPVDDDGDDSTNGGESESTLPLWLGLVVVGLALAVSLAVVGQSQDKLSTAIDSELLSRLGGSTTTERDDAESQAPETAVPAEGDSEESEEIDEELLSDEERVERLLTSNGGRMKQADIVKETDWSNAKVSQLLSSMEEEGRIDKLRIGRENLISFPDEEIIETDK
jgi:uncharacterized membrane protein